MKVFVEEDGTITGAQVVGPGAASRIDIVSALIRKKGKIWDLAFMEKSYCPGFV
jgi:pyruvate/2-oxoglutarate dehydrogenase complex dihydrolipoamide dehydrogenase (E3) component